VRTVTLRREKVPSFDAYPFSIPALRGLEELELHPRVTFFVGENGSGKSTLVEGIAVAAGFNAEGGTKNFNFGTRRSESALHEVLVITRGPDRERDGFFLRAESLYNVATEIEKLDREGLGRPLLDSYGGVSLHEQSHGESFLALAKNRFGEDGLFILDEPEAALSPQRQLSLLALVHDRVTRARGQFLIATHSPIVMAYPDATIYHLGAEGIRPVPYEETEHFRITSSFLASRESYFKHLFGA
jgi:predicted ATPase